MWGDSHVRKLYNGLLVQACGLNESYQATTEFTHSCSVAPPGSPCEGARLCFHSDGTAAYFHEYGVLAEPDTSWVVVNGGVLLASAYYSKTLRGLAEHWADVLPAAAVDMAAAIAARGTRFVGSAR